jgi:predicted Rossmann fold nucleotide-binding protein DprA/Smf involved in DNA uptake
MEKLVAVIGSRSLPQSWAGRVATTVQQLLTRGCCIGSGGATGADLFALQAVLSHGAGTRCTVFLPGGVGQAPGSCSGPLTQLSRSGGSVIPGSASVGCSRQQFIAALFARSSSLVQAAGSGVVAFISGASRGSWFTCRASASLGRPVVVFPVEGPKALQSLGCGSWVPVSAWPGAFRWVPSVPIGRRCKHGLVVQHCAGLPARAAL